MSTFWNFWIISLTVICLALLTWVLLAKKNTLTPTSLTYRQAFEHTLAVDPLGDVDAVAAALRALARVKENAR